MGRKRKIKSADIRGTGAATGKAAGISRQAANKSRLLRRKPDGSVDVKASAAQLGRLESAELRKAEALAGLRELELRQKSGELIEVAEVERTWSQIGSTIRESLEAVPDRISETVTALTDVRQVRDKLREETKRVLENLPGEMYASLKATPHGGAQ